MAKQKWQIVLFLGSFVPWTQDGQCAGKVKEINVREECNDKLRQDNEG